MSPNNLVINAAAERVVTITNVKMQFPSAFVFLSLSSILYSLKYGGGIGKRKGNDIRNPIKGEVKVGECHARCKSLPVFLEMKYYGVMNSSQHMVKEAVTVIGAE